MPTKGSEVRMRAVVNTPDGVDPVELQDVEQPMPAPNEVLVEVEAFSINRGELTLIERRPPGWRPGQDVAGVVVQPAADGSGPHAGARVVGLVEGGGWAQHVPVPTSKLSVLPDSVSCEQAATLPIAGLTALRTLRLGSDLLGRRVLVTGANGGVGRFQVELAAASGATVTAVTRRTDKVPELEDLGARTVVADVDTAGPGFDLVLESVGGSVLAAAIAKVAPGGMVVLVGNTSGEPTPVSIYDFFGHEGARLQNFMSYAATAPVDHDLAVLVDLVCGGRLNPTLGHLADWSEIVGALSLFREGKIDAGKVVLTVA